MLPDRPSRLDGDQHGLRAPWMDEVASRDTLPGCRPIDLEAGAHLAQQDQ